MSTKPHIIEITNLTKKYHKSTTPAVDNISFYVEQGAFFSFLGPNGAGKTTTISILTTLLAPTSGTVTLAGFDLQKDATAVRQNIGVIFQNPSLDQNLTAEENIRFHANLYHLYPYRPSFSLMPQAYQKQVKSLASVLDLEKNLHQPVHTLSGGMKRKLEIIRSLMHKPKVLFLDEPTTGLDPVSRQNLWLYLQQIRKEQDITVFLTTHYLEEAEGADYLCVIDKGKIVSKGTPTEIKQSLIQNYLTINSKDSKKLEAYLKRAKLKYTGNGPFIVYPDKKTAQEIIKSIPMSLSLLDIHAPSLEEAYVEIITKENHHE